MVGCGDVLVGSCGDLPVDCCGDLLVEGAGGGETGGGSGSEAGGSGVDPGGVGNLMPGREAVGGVVVWLGLLCLYLSGCLAVYVFSGAVIALPKATASRMRGRGSDGGVSSSDRVLRGGGITMLSSSVSGDNARLI